MSERIRIRRALVSVFDKTGLAELGADLARAGVEIVSTGSTAKALADAGAPVTPVEQVTGFPECLDGRVKTLHPSVHAGILADRRLEAHRAQLGELGVQPFDLVVVNLYPFAETVASGAGPDEVVEQIDIGGPAMVRAAAKNHASVAVLTSPEQYGLARAALADGGFTLDERARLAGVAFAHTAAYDMAVAGWFADRSGERFPRWTGLGLRLGTRLRYGENAHQEAAVYSSGTGGLADAAQLHGKPMSFNNYVDADAARRAVCDFAEPAVAIIKHANPCGIALGDDIAEAHRLAGETDPVSAYGGVVAANREIDSATAEQIAQVFTEVVVAPGFSREALDRLTAKKSIRLLVCPPSAPGRLEWRRIDGGALVQTPDLLDDPGDDPANWRLAAGPRADADLLADLVFAWRACRAVKSNAILLAADRACVGVGMGQVNRVDSCRLAVRRAGERAAGSVAASDAYFPFSDGAEVLIRAGVAAIVQPGGSIRDEETIIACQQSDVTLYLTGVRHFNH